jgi:CRP-like cAMP-binding protein
MSEEKTETDDELSLAGSPLFRQLSTEALSKISGLMSRTSYKAGDTIFLEREPGDALYVVESGSVRIWVRDGESNQVTLSELSADDFFGDMSVLDGGKRSANATAITDVTLKCLRRELFESFLLEHPQAALGSDTRNWRTPSTNESTSLPTRYPQREYCS